MLRKGRFGDVISRQLDLFEREQAELVRECTEAEATYDRAARDDAEELFADYQDLVETGTELLADLRDNFASTLGESAAEQYEREFNRAVARRLPRFSLEIENR
jgi:hypothetical protein